MTGSDHLSRLLAVERAASPPTGTAEVELQRLLGSLAAHAAPLPVAVGSLKLGWSVVAKGLCVGFALGVAGAGAASLVATPRSASEAVLSPVETHAPPNEAFAPPQQTVELPRPAVGAALPLPAVDEPRRRLAAPAPASVPLPSPTPSVTPALDEELRLITASKRELDQGRAHLARVWLEEHRQRFPDGVFALEREGLLVLAECSAGQRPSLARDFARRYPESPMLAQVLRRCGGEGSVGRATPAVKDFVEPDK